jgi:hypothetical protein
VTELTLPWLYRRRWNDGFAARGWKLACTVDDPEIIASTAETGARIHTSVFVHDIVDHALCGLPPSGHRAEAVALIQLAERTGSDPTPDFVQMVDEDLLTGRLLGERWATFLPPELAELIPEDTAGGRAVVGQLRDVLGTELLRERLVAHFSELGRAGAETARAAFAAHGLDPGRRGLLAMALQQLLERADALVLAQAWAAAQGCVRVGNGCCTLTLSTPAPWSASLGY